MKTSLWIVAAILLLVAVGLGLAFFRFSSIPAREVVQLPAPVTIAPSPSPTPVSTTLLFGGDMMFDRHVRLRMSEHGVDHVFAPLQELFHQYDLVIANLEGPVTNFPSRSVGSAVGSTNNFIFTFDPAIAPMLKKSNMGVVNLGNNHILNFGAEGVRQTKSILQQNEVEFFGDTTLETNPSERVVIKQVADVNIGFVGYNQFVPDGWEHALADVKYARTQSDIVIVFPHWGLEYEPLANQVIIDQAHELIDMGADLVIGSHPHVIQQYEDYQGKRIYYSLGNFVFDQYFSPETQTGLLVGVEIHPDKSFSFKEYKVQTQRDGQTILAQP